MTDIAYPSTLPCRVPLDEIYAQVVDQIPPARTEHQARCPHCRAALADLSEAWAPVAQLAAKQPSPPAACSNRCWPKVRQTSRGPDPWYGMITTDHGRTRVAASDRTGMDGTRIDCHSLSALLRNCGRSGRLDV